MHLFEVLVFTPFAAAKGRRLHEFRCPCDSRDRAEKCLSLCNDRIVIDGTGSREDHLARPIVFSDEALQITAAEIADPLGGAKDRAAQRLIGIGHLLQPVKDDIVRGVERLPDFLQNHAAFDFDFGGVKDRVQQDVRDHIKPQRHVIFQHTRVKCCHLAAGIGVDIAAHVLDAFGDLQRTACLGSLECHMLKEMRDPVLFDPFVPATGLHPDADRGRFQPRHILCDDAKAVGQRVQLDGQCVIRSLITA